MMRRRRDAQSHPGDRARGDGSAADVGHAGLFTQGLVAQLREDIAANDGLLAPGTHAVIVHRIAAWGRHGAPAWVRAACRLIGRIGFVLVRNVYGIELPRTVELGRRVHIAHQGAIVIHPHARIGEDSVIRQGVTLGSGIRFAKGGPTLGRRVSIGAGAVIAGPVRIGDDAVIGPNATVLTNVPARARVMAQPPRVLSMPSGVGGSEEKSGEPPSGG